MERDGLGTAFRGAQDVRLDVPLAGLGSRGLALLVDLTILVVAELLLVLGLQLGGLLLGDLLAGWAVVLGVVGVFLLNWGYFLAFEATSGRTPGKALLGLRVVDREGMPVGWLGAALRNLLRVADFLPFGFAVGVLVMLFDRQWRRLGDLAAGTLVVADPPEDAVAVTRVPSGLDARALRWVERTLALRASLPPERAEELEEALEAALRRSAPHLPPRPPGTSIAAWIDATFAPERP